MNEIISRWSKKSLSSIINILTGALIIIIFINQYTIINIRLEFLGFISIKNYIFTDNMIMWLLSVLLFHNFFFKIIIYILHKTLFCFNAEKYHLKYYHIKILIYTLEDILDLIISIYGLIFSITIYIVYVKTKTFYNNTYFELLTYIGIFLRFFETIFFHFYHSNLYIINKPIEDNYLK